MLSKNRIKYINALKNKKFRQAYGAFIVEGAKSVIELIQSDFTIEFILATDEFRQKYTTILSEHTPPLETVGPKDLEGIGSFQTNDSCLAVAKVKNNDLLLKSPGEYILALDDIRDPGNLGAIIRVADWYGIHKIICSKDTTDWYNPKVVAASKGSFTRVLPYYTDLYQYFGEYGSGEFIGGAFLGGSSLYEFEFPKAGGFVVMGNESNGIGEMVSKHITHQITIPRMGGAESLNVGIATAIIIDNLRRGQRL
ncbi:TrmH family RNA methyltransferase [Dyadobacter jejuensis]|uniref:TrmH family RNA methyltransferase n=1 Tax=Dyadobacter jejuensis TaxID=1082580 RepID=A0A316AN79_9BACT|nr:RNA methyltransferase [Dyadobacter jejuensis]PWJ59215.1 TrmH family RNA methyltransferase [Dyadobacter jejuensis]